LYQYGTATFPVSKGQLQAVGEPLGGTDPGGQAIDDDERSGIRRRTCSSVGDGDRFTADDQAVKTGLGKLGQSRGSVS